MWMYLLSGLSVLAFTIIQYLDIRYGEESLDDYYWRKKEEEKKKDKFEKNCA